jgi:hypothetical protein
MAAPSTRNIIPLLPSAQVAFKPRIVMFIATLTVTFALVAALL